MTKKAQEPQTSDETCGDAGAQFWAVDLHVHTPGSSDIDVSKYGDASPDDIVAAAIEAGLDAIAVTDHNTASWCDDVGEAARDKPLIVLPGIEISTTEGHLLAIFEEGTTTREIEDLLAAIGSPSARHGDLNIASNDGFIETARQVCEAGGIAIAAHVDRDKGLLGLEVGVSRKAALTCPSIAAFEVVDKEQAAAAQLKAGSERQLPIVRGSDSMISGEAGHRLDGVGQRRTWIKAGKPDLVGLRHAFNDPDLRVRIARPAGTGHAYVKSLHVSGGFLNGVDITFSPDMTCLLGGTGTGKSLVLELIRFALDQQTDSDELSVIREEVDARLDDALGTDSSVKLVVSLPDGDFTVRRAFAGPDSPPPEIVDSPDLVVSDLIPIRAFSQSEVIQYARTPVGRMLLIDGNLDLSDEEEHESEVIEELKRNGTLIVKLTAKIAETELRIDELAGGKTRLAELSELFDADTVKEQESWSAERAAIEPLQELVPNKGDLGISFDMTFDDTASNESNEDLFTTARSAIERLQSSIDTANAKVEKARAKAANVLADVEKTWNLRRQIAEAELNKAMGEAGSAGQDLSALRATLAKLQSRESDRKRLRKELKKTQRPKLKEAMKDRESAIEDLAEVRRRKRKKRKNRIESLNSLMAGVVRMKLEKETDSEAFASDLRRIAKGSNLRATTLSMIADNALPLKLGRSFINGDAEGAASAIGVNEGQLQKLFDHIKEKDRSSDMLMLQHVELRDTLTIGFRTVAEDERYVPIERLAHGQKCTAILIIALADGTEPLIVDQPEDALHAPWIEDHLVDRLRSLRGTRQFLFASRSPGLVVSADAELIVTLEADAVHGKVEASGSLERFDLNRLALHHLEGGPVPFVRRSLKFDQSLRSDE